LGWLKPIRFGALPNGKKFRLVSNEKNVASLLILNYGIFRQKILFFFVKKKYIIMKVAPQCRGDVRNKKNAPPKKKDS